MNNFNAAINIQTQMKAERSGVLMLGVRWLGKEQEMSFTEMQ